AGQARPRSVASAGRRRRLCHPQQRERRGGDGEHDLGLALVPEQRRGHEHGPAADAQDPADGRVGAAMFTFPKSISDPSAAPVPGFVANKASVPAAGTKRDAGDSFARMLKDASAGAPEGAAANSGSGRTGGAGTTGTATGASSELGRDNDNSEDKFLTLLVAQMRNQDPLNPLDNAQVTSQLAQINTVRGIEKLNASMGALVDRISSQGALDAAGLIGRQVLAEGDTLTIGDGEEPSSLAA